MATIVVNTGIEIEFSTLIDATSTNSIIVGASEKNYALTVESANRMSITRGHLYDEVDTDTDNDRVVYTAPVTNMSPTTDGKIAIKHTFAIAGRYTVKLCIIQNPDIEINDDDSANILTDKLYEEVLIPIITTTVQVNDSITSVQLEEVINDSLFKDLELE